MNDVQRAINKLQNEGYLVSIEALQRIKESETPSEVTEKILEHLKGSSKQFIGPEEISESLEEGSREKIMDVDVKGSLYRPLSKEYETDMKIINKDLSKESMSKGELEDFVNNFRSRYEKLSKILKGRGENPLSEIERVKTRKKDEVKIIAMVTDKRSTKNGHVFLELEDPTGLIKALIPKGNEEMIRESDNILNDEVLAFEGRMSKSNLFIVEDICYPDVPIRETKKIEEDLALVLTSDVHIGSRYFLRENFESFIDWIIGKKGKEKQRKLAEKVKYITIAGDLVDGVGVYPSQEDELESEDIYDQYQDFKRYLEKIPSHIEVIIGPGNHDAINRADPQPKIPEELIEGITELPNITLVGSPATIKVHGLNLLLYHGTGFDDIIPMIPQADYEKIREVMKKNLQSRHVHPIYGEKPIVPEKEDHLVIEEPPDIYHTGHVHKNDYTKYKGTICVNSGTWQEATPYQKKLGHKPTPGKLPVIELNKAKINVLKFDKNIDEKGVRIK